MTETTSSAQRPTNAAASERTERFRIKLAAGTILFALMLAVVTLRLHRLGELPYGVHHDEGTHGVNALQELRGEHAVFFPESIGREGLIVYGIALAVAFLVRTALTLRLPASAGQD